MLTITQRQSKWLIFAEAIALLLLIGVLDLVTGYKASFVIFYIAPIAIVVAHCDRNMAVWIAILASLTWSWADTAAGHPYSDYAIHVWEIGVRSVFFLLIAVVGSTVKKHHEAANIRISLLEHSQRLEHQIVEVSEYEQQRIGQDLHDGLCQYLAALGCSAAALKSDLEKSGLPKFAAVAEDLAQLLRAGISQTRNLARGLMPVQMEQGGLVSSLQELTTTSSRLLGIDCVLNCNGNVIPDDNARAMHLYRIAQEAINNATKHSKARKIDVSLSANPAVIVLSVADDGVGISQTTKNLHGMGLSIMRYRSNLIGGEFVIEERPTGGTVVSCTVRQENCGKELNVTSV
jgi:signal transduction histidine kinase